MEWESCIQWCYRVAKAFSTGARLYAGSEQVYYYSVLHLHPDPVGPYLQRILSSQAQAGVTATPCGQFYGFLTIEPELRLIVGPTRVLQDSGGSLDELLALLAIPSEAQESYRQALRAAPVISVDRLAWILSALVTALRGKPFPVEEVWMDIRPESGHLSVQVDRIQKRLDAAYDMDTQQAARQSYTWENMICTCIEEG